MPNRSAAYIAPIGSPSRNSRQRLAAQLGGYEARRFAFRVWWVRDYGKALNPGDWWRWLTAREVWNPTGGMPEWVYVRRVVSGG